MSLSTEYAPEPRMVVKQPHSDYEIVRGPSSSSRRWRDQPSLETIADEVGLKPLALQRLFTRWAGLTPKGFLQAVTLDHARALLSNFGLGRAPARTAFPARAGCTISSSPMSDRPVPARRGGEGIDPH